MLKLKANFNIQNTIRDDLVTIDKTYFYKKNKRERKQFNDDIVQPK